MGERSEEEPDVQRLYCAGLFSESHDSHEWVRCQKCLKGAYTHTYTHTHAQFVRKVGKGRVCVCVCVCVRERDRETERETGVRDDRHLFIVAA